MSIGASYTSASGARRQFELEGIPEIGSTAADMLSMSPMGSVASVFNAGLSAPLMQPPTIQRIMSEKMVSDMDKGMVCMHHGDLPTPLSNKIKPGGGLEVSGTQLAVTGFDGSSKEGGIYGNAGGDIGFHPLSSYDGNVSGTTEIVSDIDIEKKFGDSKVPNQQIIVKKKMTTIKRTSLGRIHSVHKDGEKEIFRYTVPFTFYCVRCGFEFEDGDDIHPTGIAWMAFGDEFSLDTYEGEETIDGVTYGKFKANTEAQKNGLEPPVKVISGDLLGGEKYGVKPSFVNGILSGLAFGTSKQLDDGEPENEVATQIGCPYQS